MKITKKSSNNHIITSNPSQTVEKMVVHKDFAKLTGKHLWQSLVCDKVAG